MFKTILDTLKSKKAPSQDNASQRQFSRRRIDTCVSVINGKTYPVEDWSLGGLLLYTDSRMFTLGDIVDITVKFKLRNDMIDVPHKARVVRKNMNHIALEFSPLTRPIQNKLQSVIDDSAATEFAKSQLAAAR